MEKAETNLVWKIGDVYPAACVCTVFESNQLGERRFIEQKTLSLLPEGSVTVDQLNAEVTKAERRGYESGYNAGYEEGINGSPIWNS